MKKEITLSICSAIIFVISVILLIVSLTIRTEYVALERVIEEQQDTITYLEEQLEIKETEMGALVYRIEECRGWLNYDNRIETYYSSNVLYHKFSYMWTVDDEGYYRTPEGYYVVACRDLPYGTVFFANDGVRVCQVLDRCQPNGVTDFYVNW